MACVDACSHVYALYDFAWRWSGGELFASEREVLGDLIRNRLYSDGRFAGLKEYFMCTALRKNATGASMCVGCGKCETHCPQHIPIRDMLKSAKKELEGPLYRMGKKVAHLIMKY